MKHLENIFKSSKVDFAIQFGSSITGKSHKHSDVDIAVFINPKVKKTEKFEIKLKLMTELNQHYKKNIDMVILNDTRSLFFKFTILKEGQLIYMKEEENYFDFACKTLSNYFDYEPFLNEYNKNYVQKHLQ